MKHALHLVALLVVITAAIACSKGDSRPVVIYNCPANAIEIASLEKDIPGFADSTGVMIKLNPFSGDEKLYAMIASGNPPDIFYTNTVVRDKLAAEGHLLALDSLAESDGFTSSLTQQALQQGRSIDGGLYSIGNWSYTVGIYYNTKLFDEAGIPYPDSTWTWETMVEIARKLTKDEDNNGKAERYGIFIGSHFIEALEQMNQSPLRANALFIDIPQESREVYERYLALMKEGVMPDLRRMQAMGMQAPQLLESGKVAMLAEAVPHTGLFETLTIPWRVAPLPRFGVKPPRYFRSGSGGLSIAAASKNPKASWQALQWIIAQAKIYQPNPVLTGADFTGGWETKYPKLKNSGFADVWRLSEQYNGGDYRMFVRLSSWTMSPIMEMLQPKLDQLWSRSITVNAVVAALPEINAHARDELSAQLRNTNIKPRFREALKKQLSASGTHVVP